MENNIKFDILALSEKELFTALKVAVLTGMPKIPTIFVCEDNQNEKGFEIWIVCPFAAE